VSAPEFGEAKPIGAEQMPSGQPVPASGSAAGGRVHPNTGHTADAGAGTAASATRGAGSTPGTASAPGAGSRLGGWEIPPPPTSGAGTPTTPGYQATPPYQGAPTYPGATYPGATQYPGATYPGATQYPGATYPGAAAAAAAQASANGWAVRAQQAAQAAAADQPPLAIVRVRGEEANWMAGLGIGLSLLGLGLGGVIFGAMGLQAVKAGRADNKGMAIGALVLGIINVVVVAALMVGGMIAAQWGEGYGASINRDDSVYRDDAESVYEDDADPAEMSPVFIDIDHVQVGDCVYEPTFDEQGVTGFDVVPCTQDHWGQAYYIGILPAGPYPGDDVMPGLMDEVCFTDEAQEDLTYYIPDSVYAFGVWPDEAYWEADDRSYLCVLASDEETLTESYVR